MALFKIIKDVNGVPLTYHRINDIRHVTNDKTYIDIVSYITKEDREKEQNQPKYSPNREEIYKTPSIEVMDYNSDLSIDEAYEYLKTLPRFEGAEDI